MPHRAASRWLTGSALSCLAIALLRSSRSSGLFSGTSRGAPEPLWPVASVEVKPLSLQGSALGANAQGRCGAAVAAAEAVLQRSFASWTEALERQYLMSDFGTMATNTFNAALRAFDAEAEEDEMCAQQRAELESEIKKAVAVFESKSLAFAQAVVEQEFRINLLKEMNRRGGPLRVREKMDMLRDALASYEAEAKSIQPEWDTSPINLEDAERRFGKLQFEIEESQEGQTLQRIWEQKQIKQLVAKRAHGVSVSLDPALRLMVRPEGVGNLQIFSEGPVGPPNNPAIMNIGIMNDGSIADIYREHPVPPLFAVQPAVKVKVDVR